MSSFGPINAILIIETILAFIVAVTIHEVGHAGMARALGDTLAVEDGRLSLSPQRHLAAIGTLVAVVLAFAPVYAGIGWGKPVRYDSMRLRVGPNVGTIFIALAGAFANLLVGFAIAAGLHFIPGYDLLGRAASVGGRCEYSLFSWVDSRLHGHGLTDCLAFAQPAWLLHIEQFLIILAITNVALAIVNIIPLYPLDGYKVVFALLPSPQAIRWRRWEPQMEGLLLVLFFALPLLLQMVGIGLQPSLIVLRLAQAATTSVAGPGIVFATVL